MKILILETTCDETAAAIVNEKREVLGSCVASQDDLHRKFGGVVPELASRAHLERMQPVLAETLARAGCTWAEINAVAVANTPGLAGSLLVGLATAKALAVALDIPLIAVNHLQAHIYACQLAAQTTVFPCVGLIVSGGHTNLYRCRTALEFELLGATLDDAAGEAFDKVASLLGLPYPGGPAIQKTAEQGDPRAFAFPRSLLNDPTRLEFSFSGLKTAVRYAISREENVAEAAARLTAQQIADLAASFQAAVVDVLVGKSLQALRATGLKRLCVGGGVAANGPFRARLRAAMQSARLELHVAPLQLCTDNAIMGAIALERLEAGLFSELDLDIVPGLVRNSRT